MTKKCIQCDRDMHYGAYRSHMINDHGIDPVLL